LRSLTKFVVVDSSTCFSVDRNESLNSTIIHWNVTLDEIIRYRRTSLNIIL
jgi:hypothetical protein